jgi:hypothetical protein
MVSMILPLSMLMPLFLVPMTGAARSGLLSLAMPLMFAGAVFIIHRLSPQRFGRVA